MGGKQCLSILFGGAGSGYWIKKQFEEGPFARFCPAGFGSVYPPLDRLLNQRLISLEEVNQTGRAARMCQCGEGPIADGEKFAQGTTIAIYEAGKGFLKNHGHELIDAGLRNEAGAAGRPPCSAHISEA